MAHNNGYNGTIISINVSGGGVPKEPAPQGRVSRNGLAGDWQDDRQHHGGPDRAMSLYSLERIEALRAEGHPIAPGTTGENVTLGGLDWDRLAPGSRLALGADVIVEITAYAPPCQTIRNSFLNHRFVRISQKHHPGWSRLYSRVIAEGLIRVGDPARVFGP